MRLISHCSTTRCRSSFVIYTVYTLGLKRRRCGGCLSELNALLRCIKKRILEGSGKLSEVRTVDGVVHVTFLGVTDDAHVFDTLSGALLDVRIQLEVQPNLDVKNPAKSNVRPACIWRGYERPGEKQALPPSGCPRDSGSQRPIKLVYEAIWRNSKVGFC